LLNGTNVTNYNQSTQIYSAWQWQAGAGTILTNTNGSIQSGVSVNKNAGFSIVSWTGTGVAGTVGHGLDGNPPAMIIYKDRDSASNWIVGHSFMNGGTTPWNYYLPLNLTTLQTASQTMFNNTDPGNYTFSVGTNQGSTKKHIAYCWAPIEGYSAFGSYRTDSNTTNAIFQYCGFKPKFVMIRPYINDANDTTGNWSIRDTSRGANNPVNTRLWSNLQNIESSSAQEIDFLSNGFKIKDASFNVDVNYYSDDGLGTSYFANYIWMAFAEHPFKYANAR
jgi:hypothetical protein